MQKRTLGKSGLAVSALGLGCMRMSFGDAPIGDKQEMISFLHSAVERGITFFDTAEVYGPFTNEELLGEALEPFRGQVIIASKFGFKHDPDKGDQALQWAWTAVLSKSDGWLRHRSNALKLMPSICFISTALTRTYR